jgi:hypothetical protein
MYLQPKFGKLIEIFIFSAPSVAEPLVNEIQKIEKSSEYKLQCFPLFSQQLLLFFSSTDRKHIDSKSNLLTL